MLNYQRVVVSIQSPGSLTPDQLGDPDVFASPGNSGGEKGGIATVQSPPRFICEI
jgi:hypothetical protein